MTKMMLIKPCRRNPSRKYHVLCLPTVPISQELVHSFGLSKVQNSTKDVEFDPNTTPKDTLNPMVQNEQRAL